MTPGRYNFICPQGSTFSKQITYSTNETPINLTGYTARMQVREKYTSTNAIVSLTSGNGITLGGSAGTITINISAATTTTLVAKEYVYDLELVSGSTVTRILEGRFLVTPEVTR